MMSREAILSVYEQGPEEVIALVEALFARIEGQQEQLGAQQEQISLLTRRVGELEDRLSKNSRNSSKPPSSDELPPKPKSLREPSGRKPGGQPGHPGETLLWVEEPDRVVGHLPERCEGCGESLAGVVAIGYEGRQVVDLPPLALEVTEHQAQCKRCPGCGRTSSAAFPPGVAPGIGYGPRIKGLGVYLMYYQLLPYWRTSELLSDLVDASLSVGTLFRAVEHCSEELADIEGLIKRGVQQAEVAHFDETGIGIAGEKRWLHVACTRLLTHYGMHPKRGSGASREIGILPEFGGVAVHDGLYGYREYECEHASCNAHHLRELTFIEERHGQEWAGKMKALLLDIKREVEAAIETGRSRLRTETLEGYLQRYQGLIEEGIEANPPLERTGKPGRPRQTKGKNLVDRLDKRRDEVLRFMHDFRVPFDNNQAERDVRMIKTQQKVSGCFRTTHGAAMFCRIRGYISTAKKQGQSALDALERVFTGNPFVPTLQG